jgi:hypothetical protein
MSPLNLTVPSMAASSLLGHLAASLLGQVASSQALSLIVLP